MRRASRKEPPPSAVATRSPPSSRSARHSSASYPPASAAARTRDTGHSFRKNVPKCSTTSTWSSSSRVSTSDPFDDRGRGHPGAGAHRHEGGREVAPLELVQGGLHEHRPGGPDGVAEGNGA